VRVYPLRSRTTGPGMEVAIVIAAFCWDGKLKFAVSNISAGSRYAEGQGRYFYIRGLDLKGAHY
jgi:hypothetical protein